MSRNLQPTTPIEAETAGRSDLDSCYAKVSMACSILAGQNSIGMILPLLHFGTEEQRQRFLPEVAKGRTLTSVSAVPMSRP